MRRGDNIPSISDYAHWNEDAARVWYEENRYDMEHWDEEMGDDDDGYGYDRYEPDPFEDSFVTEAEARAFIEKYAIDEGKDTLTEWNGEWIVEHYDKKAHAARKH